MKINFPQSTNQTETTHKSINNSKNRDNGVVNQQIIEQRQRTSLSIKQKQWNSQSAIHRTEKKTSQ